MKKLINWLIHILGGYTEEEYNTENIAFETSRDYAKALEENAKRRRDRYNAEHEAYLALLNAHNASAEVAQNNNAGVSGAIDTIKAYCKSKGSCNECALYNKNSGCKTHEIPCYWGGEVSEKIFGTLEQTIHQMF